LIGSIAALIGLQWKVVAAPSNTYRAVSYAPLANGNFFAFAGASSEYYYSVNGVDWTQGTMPISATFRASAAGNGSLFAAANATANIYKTTNGTTWTATTGPGATTPYQGIYDGTSYMFVNSSTAALGLVYSSNNGSSWTGIDVGSGGYAIAYDNISRYVVLSAV
jgi:hypothetical protein